MAGALAFAVIGRGLGRALRPDAGSPANTSVPGLAATPEPTTTTRPPPPSPPPLEPLQRRFSAAVDGLRTVEIAGTANLTAWEPTSMFPIVLASVAQARWAQFSADGSQVAILTDVGGGTLVIDSADGGAPRYVRDAVTSARWHPVAPDRLAWTKRLPEWTLLRIGTITPQSGHTPVLPDATISLPLDTTLRAWGDWGFLVEAPDEGTGSRLILLDPDGTVVAEPAGRLRDITPDGTLLLLRPDAAGRPMLYLLPPDLEEVPLPGLDIGAADYRITGDAAWIVAVSVQADGRTSILARATRSNSTRITSIDGPARVIDFGPTDRFLVLQEVGSGDLVFHDWKSGAAFRVPAGRGRVAAVDF